MEQYMVWIWLAIFIVTLVVEAITQDFVSVWFSVGSLVALCISGFVDFWVEIIVFSVVSVVALICTRPLVKKLMSGAVRKTNTDEFIGKRIKTITEISKFNSGEVKLNGIVYTAILMEAEEESIPKDSIVEIVALKGNKVVVKKINE